MGTFWLIVRGTLLSLTLCLFFSSLGENKHINTFFNETHSSCMQYDSCVSVKVLAEDRSPDTQSAVCTESSKQI